MARPRSSTSVLAVALLLGLLAGAAEARTARLVKEGIKLLNRAQYGLAIGKFDEAYRDDKTLTRTLLLMGVCHLNLDHLPEAIDYYERFETEERDIGAEDRARLVSYYDEATTRLRTTPPGPDGPARALLIARAVSGGPRPEEAVPLFDAYERQAGALPAEGAAALRGHRLRLAARLRVRVAAPEGAPLALPLARLLLTIGEWPEALALLDQVQQARRAAVPDGGEPPPALPELQSLRAGLVAAQGRDGGRRELPLLLGYTELLLGDEGAALGRYAAYLKERPKAAPDGPYEPQLRQLAERTAAEAEARHRQALEAKRRADTEAAAARKAEAERRLRAALLPAPAPAPAKQPIYKKWWFWTAIGGGVALGASAAVLGTQLGKPQAATPSTSVVLRPEF